MFSLLPHNLSRSYSLKDGQQRNETGFIKRVLNANGQAVDVIVVTGQFVFVGTNGIVYRVIYTADETGFHPKVVILPADSQTPIDPNCLKSLCG
jgi:inorganic pyrophosphatase